MASDIEKFYIGDFDKEKTHSAKLIRAGNKVGTILSINIPKEIEEDKKFIIAGDRDCLVKTIQIEGDKVPLFASKKIEYPGQPIFIASHPDPKVLSELSKKISIVISEEDSFDLDRVFPDDMIYTPYVYTEKTKIFKENPQPLFDSAFKILEKTYSTGVQDHYYSGHQGAIIEKTKDSFKLISATEHLPFVTDAVSQILQVPSTSFSSSAAKNPSSFCGKLWFPALLAAQLAVLYKKSKESIKIIFTKEEDILYTTKRAPLIIKKKSAFDKDGKLIAEKTDILINAGAYPVLSKRMIDSAIQATQETYKSIPSQVSVRIVKTSNPTMDFLSGSCESAVHYAVERHQDYCAKYFNTIPAQWRLDQFATPYRPIFTKMLEFVSNEIDYQRKKVVSILNKKSKNLLDSLHRRKGVGLACAIQTNGTPLQKNKPNFGACSIEVKMNPVSREIVPVSIVLAFRSGHISSKPLAIQQIRVALEQAIQWIKTDQRSFAQNIYSDFVLPPLSALPKLEINVEDNLPHEAEDLSSLVFSLIPSAFCEATSQALDSEILSIPIIHNLNRGDEK